MSTGTRFTAPYATFTDPNGVPYTGAQLFFYASGTSTPQDTYVDSGLTTPNANPVLAASNGTFPNIFLSGSPYKVVLEDINGNQIWTADPVEQSANGGVTGSVPVGMLAPWAGPTPGGSYAVPAGWYLCYGQAISRTTYALLFAQIGTTWGAGDGSTTFNVPDLRGRALFGADNMGGGAAGRLTTASIGVAAIPGAVGGGELLQSHTHTASVTDPGHAHTVPEGWSYDNNDPGAARPVAACGAGGSYAEPTTTSTTGISVTNATSGAGASQNVPPAAVIQWIIYAGA